MEASSSAFKDYSNKASEYMGSAKKTAVDKGVVGQETANKAPGAAPVGTDAFPSAPKTELPPAEGVTGEKKEPVLA